MCPFYASSSKLRLPSCCSPLNKSRGLPFHRHSGSGGDSYADLTCLCPYGNEQYFEEGKCRGYVGSICDPSEACSENADCVSTEGESHHCECREGFVESADRKCDIAHNYDCGTDSLSHLFCDRQAGLKCRIVKSKTLELAPICSCHNLMDVYESERRKCSSRAGSICREGSDCVKNAVCNAHENPEKFLTGRCKCEEGLTWSETDLNCFRPL